MSLRSLPITGRLSLGFVVLFGMAAPATARPLEAPSARAPVSHDLVVRTTGFGWVSGPGIYCYTDCEESYPAGTTVTLYPHRTAGSVFVGWEGDCSGRGPCELVMSADRFASATFREPPPETVLTRARIRAAQRRATFTFDVQPGPGTAAYFQCKLNRRPYRRCASPKAYRNLPLGRHVFRVRAVGPEGQVDRSPALRRFRIPRPR